MSQSNNNDFRLSEVFNVKGKVALVTGGGSGIGLMATQALAVNGAKVYIVGRTEEKLEAVVKTHGQNIDGEIIPLTADISSKSEIASLVKEIESREKCLCILINNAGINGATQPVEAKTAEEMKKNLFDDESSTFEDWCNTYRTNVPQQFFMTTAFLPLLQKATEIEYGYSSTVINISSISGIEVIATPLRIQCQQGGINSAHEDARCGGREQWAEGQNKYHCSGGISE